MPNQMFATILQYINKRLILQMLALFLPFALLVNGAGFFFYQTKKNEELNRNRANEAANVKLGKVPITYVFEELDRDILYLSQNSELKKIVEKPTPENMRNFAEDMLNLSRTSRIYDKIRWLDETGMERIRVNFNDGNPTIVSTDQLQYKGDRYFFTDAYKLNPGEIYISPFDLNVEQDKLEIPYKPTLRIGMSVSDSHGNKRGVVLLNYLGVKLITRFNAVTARSADHIMLLNRDGYWLKSPRPEDEWGFMLKRDNLTLAQSHPTAWQRITKGSKGQFEDVDGLWTFDTVYPLTKGQKTSSGTAEISAHSRGVMSDYEYQWKVVSHLSPGILYKNINSLRNSVLTIAALLLLLLFIFSWLLVLVRTKRKKAEEALQENRNLIQAIMDNSMAVIYLKDLDGRYMLVNKQYETLFHYSKDELLGKTDHDLFPKDMADAYRGNDRMVIECRHPVEFEEIGLQDGKLHTYISIKFPLLDSSGKPYALCGISTDITERKHAEETLKKYSEELEENVRDRTKDLELANTELKKIFNAIEQAAEAIVITDVDGAIQYVNPAFSVMNGYSIEDVVGRNPRILNSGMNPPELFTDMWRTILSGNKWVGTLINKKKTGELYHEEITVNPVINNAGKITNFIAIANDISDRIEAEENLKKKNIELEAAKDMAEAGNRAKSEFLANMSHELRTPLNAIIGFSDLLKSDMAGPITEEQRGFAGDIHESGQHLLRLISDILELSRIEAGKEELEITEFSLDVLIKESLMMFHEKAIKHNIKLTTDVAGDIGNIKADARKMKQVVLNLLSNATKFTPDGAEVGIKASKTEDEVIVTVWDTGIGIKEEDMQRLFMPFVQLERHLTKKYAGTGLGLTLCRKFVDMHGGRIWVESEFGKGSRFTFTIPR